MPLRIPVLATEINNLSDARYFAAYPVDWMSFVCNSDAKNYVPVDQIKEIVNWITGPAVALDVRGCNAEEIEAVLQELNVEVLITESSQELSTEMAEHYQIFCTVIVPADGDFSQVVEQINEQQANAFILDLQSNGIAMDVAFSEDVQYLARTNDILLQADIDIKRVSELIASDIKGLVVIGGEEEKVGIRSFEDVQDLMEELEEWD